MKKRISADSKARIDMKLVLYGVFAIILSCNGQRKVVKNSENNGDDAPLTLILQDNYSGIDSSGTMIIKDSKALKSFYSKVNKTRKPGLPVPEIDFSKEMVLVLCSGTQNKGSLPSLKLKKETEDEIIFRTVQKTDGSKSVSTASISPFCIYKMPMTSKAIRFDRTE